ncbi:MAG: peptide chain release factor 1 [Defluviitaleaceae bacterium]|nr:peptide chain release factor 1 [Defluviitaleaceae bacterium]MCL2836450.1 peptide chain release factor 1 [Defluviitaleaceae bacterium]
MFAKLDDIEVKYDDISNKINDPDIIANQKEWRGLMKEHSYLTPLIEKYREYKKLSADIEENREMLEETNDEEFRDLIKEEFASNKAKFEVVIEELKVLLLPRDPNDEKNVIVEIRGGAGGDEAALFAYDLYRMYCRYAERRRFKTELMSCNENGLGGFKEVVFQITGKGAYSRLKYESGVHRVQRIPTTESQGRIHTSTVTVAVLPEAEEVDVELDMNDCTVDVYRSSGNGGQSVNTTDSAVRITHHKSGIVVTCQDEKSQLKNRDKAMKILRSKLYELELQRQKDEISKERRSQVGTGDRSERIRTYNYPQGRVTDHRINLTLYKLDYFLDGDLDEMSDSLITAEQSEKLKGA